MSAGNNVLLYVRDPVASAAFYAELLGYAPVESSPGFALFHLSPGFSLGLWRASAVEPAPTSSAGCCEIGFKVADRPAVDAQHAAWQRLGTIILLPPTDMDFGRSFVAADPDGHRLRVYALAEDM